MLSYLIDSYGDEQVLELRDIDIPRIHDNQVLVKIHAASVNPVDWKIRKGELKFFSGNNFPRKLGSDFSGEIVSIGKKVSNFKLGDAVFGFVDPFKAGAYAEYIAVSTKNIVLKPSNLNFEEASACPLAGVTALKALIGIGFLKAYQNVLINGASGGVGSFAVQICKALDAKVTAVCSQKNIGFVNSLGADKVIDYTQVDWTQLNEKYDLIFDTVGSSNFRDCQSLLSPKGVYISLLPKINHLWDILLTLFASQKAKLVVVNPDLVYLEQLREHLISKNVKPCINQIYPFSELSAAHRYSETQRAIGKIVIQVSQ